MCHVDPSICLISLLLYAFILTLFLSVTINITHCQLFISFYTLLLFCCSAGVIFVMTLFSSHYAHFFYSLFFLYLFVCVRVCSGHTHTHTGTYVTIVSVGALFYIHCCKSVTVVPVLWLTYRSL
jgi:hypothetical protein